MKQLMAFLLLAFFSSASVADGAADDSCNSGCAAQTGNIKADQIMIDFIFMEGNKRLPAYSFNVITPDGVPVSINQTSGSYGEPGTITSGISATLLPTIMKDGKIKIAITVAKKEVYLPDYHLASLKRNEVGVTIPEVDTFIINTNIVANERQNENIPFGPLVDASQTKYTIKIMAHKLNE